MYENMDSDYQRNMIIPTAYSNYCKAPRYYHCATSVSILPEQVRYRYKDMVPQKLRIPSFIWMKLEISMGMDSLLFYGS